MSSSWYASVWMKNDLCYLIWEWSYSVRFPGMRCYESKKFGRHFILFDVVPNSYLVGLWYASVWKKNDLSCGIWQWSYWVRFPGMRWYERKIMICILSYLVSLLLYVIWMKNERFCLLWEWSYWLGFPGMRWYAWNISSRGKSVCVGMHQKL